MDNGGALALFFKQLEEKKIEVPVLGAFLAASSELPLELPLLKEIREFPALPGGTQGSAGRAGAAGVGSAAGMGTITGMGGAGRGKAAAKLER
ncbi:MAG: hypothetical protein LBH73_01690, partial [Spirochaetaceae bacterium]|nr:hypothetical protein [Spirochaetaceae bacterium]